MRKELDDEIERRREATDPNDDEEIGYLEGLEDARRILNGDEPEFRK